MFFLVVSAGISKKELQLRDEVVYQVLKPTQGVWFDAILHPQNELNRFKKRKQKKKKARNGCCKKSHVATSDDTLQSHDNKLLSLFFFFFFFQNITSTLTCSEETRVLSGGFCDVAFFNCTVM